ncbi:Uncharacterized conserved protein, contains NRDE domain [Anaerobranca californiensis DSM 14826]|jgi:uncharacterized protein with NRDE domain|uniref:Uncharacterized conserved protein, contains NRDE domain n=1 Tax=Anaerobranca californiensis DSM 14826 TaxID=1120989 RepID=A0A1M6QBS1_9FIRM|nr:NRDE family protein [Anaerobranca californiensis]SHK17570.1 Uncharacterized conserved protein, contains NRDE domain [Anaerobranca californiensis DSM 14826]
MCTILFAYKVHRKYPFIFLGNRDEFKNRETKPSHFWQDNPKVLAGIDLLKGGTWTGITKGGKIAFITNYRDFRVEKKSPLSRGDLVRQYLIGSENPKEYLELVRNEGKKHNLFNLVVGDQKSFYYYSNVTDKIIEIQRGIHGLSNALLNTPWPKVVRGKEALSTIINGEFTVDQLFEILADQTIPPDRDLPDTGTTLEIERMLSTIHIDTPSYGTRVKTVILIDQKGEVQFYEKFLSKDNFWELREYKFIMDSEGG